MSPCEVATIDAAQLQTGERVRAIMLGNYRSRARMLEQVAEHLCRYTTKLTNIMTLINFLYLAFKNFHPTSSYRVDIYHHFVSFILIITNRNATTNTTQAYRN